MRYYVYDGIINTSYMMIHEETCVHATEAEEGRNWYGPFDTKADAIEQANELARP